jgi:hypothetical protein
MSDAASLRTLLARVDGSQPAIQAGASAMMKHYTSSAGVAVNEWRNALQAATQEQLLPLLYVANEVLQISKRNRGNKFLEAMSPILGQALAHICKRDSSQTERVRRTIKIWGDRQVFSVRFVNELLQGLEPYREDSRTSRNVPPPPSARQPSPAAMSPAAEEPPEDSSGSEDDIMDMLDGSDEAEGPKLDLDINLDMMAEKAPSFTPPKRSVKRRRSIGDTTRRKTMSSSNLVEVWNQLLLLQQSYEHAKMTLDMIDKSFENKNELGDLVGDELQNAFDQNKRYTEQMAEQRRKLHEIAQERHALEMEAQRYLPWLEKGVKEDEGDLELCDQLEQKIESFRLVHAAMKKARDERREEERKKRLEDEEKERKRKEKEEGEKFRRAALAKETEAKPGMVWNPSTREYQSLNTEESWRD